MPVSPFCRAGPVTFGVTGITHRSSQQPESRFMGLAVSLPGIPVLAIFFDRPAAEPRAGPPGPPQNRTSVAFSNSPNSKQPGVAGLVPVFPGGLPGTNRLPQSLRSGSPPANRGAPAIQALPLHCKPGDPVLTTGFRDPVAPARGGRARSMSGGSGTVFRSGQEFATARPNRETAR